MTILVLHAYCNNEYQEIDHAVVRMDAAFTKRVYARKEIIDMSLKGDTEVREIVFYDGSASFVSEWQEESDGVASTGFIVYPDDMAHKFDERNAEPSLRCISMVVTPNGFSFRGFNKYTGDTVNTEEIAFARFPEIVNNYK